MLHILIVDDHAVVRGGIAQFLSGHSDYGHIDGVSTGTEALLRITETKYDLLLLDLNLPDIHGLEVLRRVRQLQPSLPVLIFSMYPEDDYALTSIDGGAAGYLAKDSPPEEILMAIARVARGERYVSGALADKLLARSVGRRNEAAHENLSEREFQVMLLLTKGMSLVEIGTTLHLSPKTVSTYRARMLDKLGITSNVELVRYVLEHKLDA